ncbi:MAG: Holliday junction branch migration protein RuvA [Saprospiraceae bacterium]|nr:Holliday junction branch migration protein RuvA [Saprospiraceae bacterium]
MIGYVKGAITYKSPTFIYVECSGVGYHVNISLFTYSKIEKLEHVKLLTHLHVKEDGHTLFGFYEAEERSLFVHLLSVSGIGPNTARIVLSSMAPPDVRDAILTEDELAFKQVKGIGAKTAKQIILDLKSKVSKMAGGTDVTKSIRDNTLDEEALSALSALGFNRNQIIKSISAVHKSDTKADTLEALIKAALKRLSS